MAARLHVFVSPRIYAVLWSLVAALHGVCAVFLAGQAAMLVYLLTSALPLLSNMEIYAITVDRSNFPAIASAFSLLSAAHLYKVTSMIYRSLRARRLEFAIASDAARSDTTDKATTTTPSASWLRRSVRVAISSIKTAWKALDVTSPHYGVIYVVRESIQTALQTYQAYRLSSLVAHQWMNHMNVALLAINCFSAMIIRHVSPHSSTGASRLLCVMVNLLLDVVANVVFPMALALPYFRDFNPQVGNFDWGLWYTDKWLIQIVYEWRMLFVTSWWDGFTKCWLAYNILRSLTAIPKLLRSKSASVSHHAVSVQPAQPSRTRSRASSRRKTSSVAGTVHQIVWEARVEHWGHRGLFSWGLAVVILHTQAALTGSNDRCVVQVRPWFSPRPACSLFELRCDGDNQLTGGGADFDASIDSFDARELAYLIVRDCPAVEITPRIREFRSLLAVKIHNSTLVRWGDDASPTQTHTPHMLFVFIAACNMTTLPRALYGQDFPDKFKDIEIVRTNLTELPDEIADVWPSDMFFLIEESRFASFPPVLARLRVAYLSIACNNFSEIPSALYENPALDFLILNGNPVKELPALPAVTPGILVLGLVGTQIASLPAWVDPAAMLLVSAGSSPFCEALVAGDASALHINASTLELWKPRVNCTPVEQLRYITFYPLADEASHNALRR